MSTYPELLQQIHGYMGKMGKGIPDTMRAFGQLHHSAVAPGALTAKEKLLMALGIAVAVRCKGCIAMHVHDALKAGATEAEVLETLGIAVMMGGGPSVMYATEAMQAMEQFREVGVK